MAALDSNRRKTDIKTVLSDEQNGFYKSIGEVLSNHWDPLGATNSEWSNNHYEIFVPMVYKWAIESNKKEDLIERLDHLACNELGVETNFHNDRRVAELILAVRDFHFNNSL